jgi:hypothetical protein
VQGLHAKFLNDMHIRSGRIMPEIVKYQLFRRNLKIVKSDCALHQMCVCVSVE